MTFVLFARRARWEQELNGSLCLISKTEQNAGVDRQDARKCGALAINRSAKKSVAPLHEDHNQNRIAEDDNHRTTYVVVKTTGAKV
jgi:hypothetical protein